jgi:hypothetical protein
MRYQLILDMEAEKSSIHVCASPYESVGDGGYHKLEKKAVKVLSCKAS